MGVGAPSRLHQIRAGFLCKDEIQAGVFISFFFVLFPFSLCTRFSFPAFNPIIHTFYYLNQIRNVVRQLLDDGLIKSLNVLQQSLIILRDEVEAVVAEKLVVDTPDWGAGRMAQGSGLGSGEENPDSNGARGRTR